MQTDSCYTLEEGWLKQARRVRSPNFGPRPPASAPDLLVVHNISLPPGQFGGNCIERLFTNCLDWDEHPFFAEIRGAEVSAHLLIERGGPDGATAQQTLTVTPAETQRVALDANGRVLRGADGEPLLETAGMIGISPTSEITQQPITAVPAFVGSYYRDLEIRDLTGGAEGVASYVVSGRVYNGGPEEAVDVQVVLTAYDPLDRVIAMRTIAPEYNVAPVGGETAFSAVLSPVGGPVARVAAVAQGRRISAAPQPGN